MDDTVASLLTEWGSDLTLTRQITQVYTPSTGVLSAGTAQSFTIRGVFINYLDKDIDGTVIRMGDRRLLVQALDTTATPQIGDKVSGLEIVDVRTVAPNGVAAAWSCQVRK